MTLEGQDVVVEVAHRQDLEDITQRCQRHYRPEGGLAEGAFGRDRLVQTKLVVEVGASGKEHPQPVPQVRAQRRGEGHQGEADVAALQGVPLVAQDGHDGAPHRRAPRHVHADGQQHGHYEDLRAVVQVAQVPQSQRPQKGARGQEAGEVAHGPGAPAVHACQQAEDHREHHRRPNPDQQREGRNLAGLPAVQSPPVGVGLGRVRGQHVEELRQHQQQEAPVGHALQQPRGGQDVGRVALRSLEEEHGGAQGHHQHHVAAHELQTCIAEVHRDPAHAGAQALQRADALRCHLEAPVKVLVEIPHNE
mmetsp:Transcript_75826/g.181399  ORF Transcript_75826/g.181399 Transcript_75826/m.181399 type:complete len:306 (-) Transcript_75826:119-1036(-)